MLWYKLRHSERIVIIKSGLHIGIIETRETRSAGCNLSCRALFLEPTAVVT